VPDPLDGPLRLIVNPSAGDGGVRRLLPRLLTALTGQGLVYQVEETTGPEDAEARARRAIGQGSRYLVAVGGDGTVNGVVNGMFAGREPLAGDAVLAVVGAGTGCDFVRTFGLDRNPEILARHLASPATMDIDVGVVRCRDDLGREQERLFANVGQVGYGAEVVRFADRLPRRLGRVRYLLAAWAAIAKVERTPARLTVDHFERDLELVELVVANGQFFGGGMKVAPRALLDDGRYNVLAFTGRPSQVFLLTIKLFQGEHLPDPEIVEYQSTGVTIAPVRPLPVEVDGEVVGRTPARFELIEKVLRVKI
jgi:diacylglycerol kinase (ATP)